VTGKDPSNKQQAPSNKPENLKQAGMPNRQAGLPRLCHPSKTATGRKQQAAS
jgi:hypothetical protein